MNEQLKWRYCAIGNIIKSHLDENKTIRYGSKAFSGGTKVYICGKCWNNSKDTIEVLGLNRFGRYEVEYISINLIENVRMSRIYKPKILSIINSYEAVEGDGIWWDNTTEDREQIIKFIELWKEMGFVKMQKVYEFLKKCDTYYLATVENGRPRVRPFGTVNVFDGKLYIQTGKVKPVSKQIAENPKVEICAFDGDTWLRLAGELAEDDRVEARKAMLDSYPELRRMYDENDGNTQVLYFKNATATFSSFTKAAEVIEF